MRSIMLCDMPQYPHKVYTDAIWQRLAQIAGLEQDFYCKEDILANPQGFADVDFVFSTWGMVELTEEQIRRIFPRLQCIFYGAGSVQHFARPYLNCGIRLFSAWGANGVPVAEYTVAQIILANKGFFLSSAAMSAGRTAEAHAIAANYPGNYEGMVGIIGAGMIGKLVIRLLKSYQLEVLVFDPFLPEETAQALGVRKCTLEEVFANCQVVSNHLANLPETQGMLNEPLFASMRPYATFLNTGRGAQVVEADLAKVLICRPDLTAVLDVTWPEPPVEGHPFYQLPNCILSPHIAGSSGNEVHRMAEYMVDEFLRYTNGQPCQYEVSLKMLETMA